MAMSKAEMLEHWRKLKYRNPLEVMQAIRYGTKGSTFGADGVRISGSPEFLDAVASCLMPLLEGENADTRLQITRNDVTPNEIDGKVKEYPNAVENAEVLYIQLYERGSQARSWNRFTNAFAEGEKDG